jgi:glycosyltransferase involved in cell wall biosynthesis
VRILTLAHRWIPEHNAGAELMLHGMLCALAARGREVVVLLSHQDGDEYKLDGLRIIPGADDPCVRGWIADPDTAVVVTHLASTPRATMLAKWSGKPVVQVLHNTMDITREWLVREPVALAVHNSQWMLADYRGWCIATGRALPHSIIVRPPVYATDYATTPGDRVTLINLRRMESSPSGLTMGKGAELFWQLAERMPDTLFLGVKGAYGSQFVRDDLPNVEVLEHVPHDRMREKVYARTRVLLMPSSYESWGRTAVEAMASGIPVVYHPTDGLREAVGWRGIAVHRDDLDGWAHSLRWLSKEDFYAQRSTWARERSAELDPTEDLRAWCEAVESLRR